MPDPQAAPRLDPRFSDPEAGSTPWRDIANVLAEADLYWLTTVLADGRPHVTPLIGVWQDDAAHFCTGLREQKAHNLDHHEQVALTTGSNSWARGLDVVVEGTAARVTDRETLQRLADAYESKYGSDWHFDVGDGVFVAGDNTAAVFRIDAAKVLAFAKDPHAQTTHRFIGR